MFRHAVVAESAQDCSIIRLRSSKSWFVVNTFIHCNLWFVYPRVCAAHLKFCFQTDLGCKNSASYAGKTVAFNRPSAPQENQCLLSPFLTTLGAQEKTDCSSMLWSIMDNIHGSIDICQNKVSAGWPPDRIAGSGVDPSRSSTFLKLSADKLLVFKWSQAQV